MRTRSNLPMMKATVLFFTALMLVADGQVLHGPSARNAKANPVRPVSSPKPNVLLIAVDDINDWLGVLGGHPQVRTPNFDRLARRGVLFTRAYCAAPACNPSRVALLTGVRPSTSGMYFNEQKFRKVFPEAVTLPQYFAKHDYRVIGGGKIFHSHNPDRQSWQWYLKHQLDPIDRGAPQKELPDNYRWKPIKEGGDEAMGDYQVVRWAEQELAKAPVKPTFMAVGLYRPHMPWMVPKKYFDQYPLDAIQLPGVGDDDLADLPAAGRWMATHRGLHDKIVALDQWKPAVRGYLASIAFSDAMLGQLLDAFDKSPWKDNTIIVLWGDHGMHLGEKQHWTKYALWEKSTRTPMMIVAPAVTRAKQRCDTPVSLLDIYPTLLQLCGLPEKDGLSGTSLVPQLRNPKADRDAPAITTFGPNNHAVRLGYWRYIHYADGGEELYDHRNDPHERNNLAANERHAASKQRLASHLPKVNKSHDAPSKWKLPDRFFTAQPRIELRGIVLDNEAAEYTGQWVTSTNVTPIVGKNYQHDNNRDHGRKRATFTPDLPAAGNYEVRLLYAAGENRSSKTVVTVFSADGEKALTVNQRQPALVNRIPLALGVFRFEAGKKGRVVVSNDRADGYVVVDGVQFVPVDIAREERAGKRAPGFAETTTVVSPPAPTTAPDKPARADEAVQLAASASPAAIDGRSYDFCVIRGHTRQGGLCGPCCAGRTRCPAGQSQ